MERHEIRREIQRLEALLDREENEVKEKQQRSAEDQSVTLRLKKGERLTIIIAKPVH